jgi:energy-coupling factor transporter ATP-binding protein EcfA2
MTALLTGRDLHKSFGLTQALRGARITLNSGEIVAVMGSSGCGKSTLLHCLAGILARLSRGVPGLIAAHWIAADPYAALRTVSIVVLAVSTITYIGTVGGQLDPRHEPQHVRPKPGVVVVYTGGVPESKVAPLLSQQAVAVRARGEFGLREVSYAALSGLRYVSCPHPEASGLTRSYVAFSTPSPRPESH